MLELKIVDKNWTKQKKYDEWLVFFKKIIENIPNIEYGKIISLLLCNNDAIQKLNKKYRNKNKPTNTLSFPSLYDDHLGDIALAYDIIIDESKEKDKIFLDHVSHLTVHSILHLLGHNHDNNNDRITMEKQEVFILSRLGVKNPYEY